MLCRITGAAVKELTIETELRKLSDVWRAQRFELFKYMKACRLLAAGIHQLPGVWPDAVLVLAVLVLHAITMSIMYVP